MSAALRPSDTDGFGNGLLPALACHALLVWALAVGVNWRASDDAAVAEAELWAAVPQAAAPRAEETPAPPPPPPVQAPRPDPRVAAEQARLEREAEIAERREQRRREELRRQAEEEREEKARKARELKAQKDKQALQQKKQEAERRAAEQQRNDKAAKAEEARREAQRQENLRRMQGLAGASGSANASGSALQSAGPSAAYAGRIKARIRPNITMSEPPAGNPLAEVEVRTAPDGLILSRRLSKPSGNAAWDDAVLRAIDKSERLPRDTDGRVPPVLVIAFRPND